MFSTRTATAAFIALAIGAGSPAVASAAPNQGGGTSSDSAYCKGLRDRAQRFNDIAQDTSQPKSVRAFYRNRAMVVLDAARRAGCGWATFQAAQSGPTERAERTGTGPATRTARTTKTRQSFTTVEKRRKARRLVGKGTVKPSGGAGVVYAKVSAAQTNDPKLNSYCNAVADLINDAEAQGDHAAGNGDSSGAQEWWDLSEHMIDVSTGNGCRFQS